MRQAVIAVQMLVRLLFLALLALGIAFWTGHALNFVPLHMALGIALVLCLWITSALAASAGVSMAAVARGAIWGIVVAAFGATQMQILPGPAHWIVQVLHLAIGMVAIALNERLARAVLDTSSTRPSTA